MKDREQGQSLLRFEQQQAAHMAFGVMVFAWIETIVLSILFTTLLNQFGMVELGSYTPFKGADVFTRDGFLSIPAAIALFMGIEFAFVSCRIASRHNNMALFKRLGIASLVLIFLIVVLFPIGITVASGDIAGLTGDAQPASLIELMQISKGA